MSSQQITTTLTLMSKAGMESAINTFSRADDTPVGKLAKQRAREDLLNYAESLALFAGLNGGTLVAKHCYKQAHDLQILVAGFSTIRI